MPALDSMACSNMDEEPVVRRKDDLGSDVGYALSYTFVFVENNVMRLIKGD